MNGLDLLPNDLAAAHAMLRVERAARQAAEAQLAERDTALAHQLGEVAALRFEIERLEFDFARSGGPAGDEQKALEEAGGDFRALRVGP